MGDGTDYGAGIPGCVLYFCIGGSKYSQFGRPRTITVLSASRLGSAIYVGTGMSFRFGDRQMFTIRTERKTMPSLDQLTVKILYWLSLDTQARALAERLLVRFRAVVGDLPASAEHHHSEAGGLYQHSLEVGLRALEEFEGNILMERKPDGSVDSFRSARNRPRWQYATFIAALCHDLGKLFDLEVRGGEQRWCPLHQPLAEFHRRARKPVTASCRVERKNPMHAVL